MKNLINKNNWLKRKVMIMAVLFVPASLFAAGPPKPSELSNPLAIVLLTIIIGLLLVIAVLANVVIGAAKVNLQRYVEEKGRNAAKVATIIALCFLSTMAFAADAPAAVAAADDSTIAGLSSTSFYTLLSVIFLEIIILLVLLYNLKALLTKETIALAGTDQAPATSSSFIQWWEKFNSFKPIKEEANIDLGHDYDGIRELDNKLPGWWLYGFYACILFACIYLYRYHVAHSAPLSKEELQISMDKAEIEKQEYLKKAGNSIDENTVKLLTDPADLAEGKKVFTTICAACHRPDGGGLIGPNLTDDYWLHGGSINEIFKTIKYGWPDKGMQSWKDNYSPKQIAQIASYVKSIHGTNPQNPKAPQGVLVTGGDTKIATADSTKSKVDTAAKK